jgi:O-antigen/teichoic acid export membrane protein
MSSDGNQARRALAWLGGGTVLASLLQYVLLFAAARQLGVAAYGEFALALAFSLLLAPLCDLGTSIAIVCTGAQRPERLGQHGGAALRWRLMAFVPTLLIGLGIGQLAGFDARFLLLFLALLLAAVVDGAVALLAAICQVQGRLRVAAALQVGRNLCRAIAVLATVAVGGEAVALALAFAAASLPMLWLGLRFVRSTSALDFCLEHLRPTLRAAWPFGFAGFGTIVHGQVAIALLGLCADEVEVGGYHAAVRFLLLLQLLPQIVATALAPIAYRQAREGIAATTRIYRLKLSALSLVGVLAAVGLAAASDELVGCTLGDAFAATTPLLALSAPVVFLKFVNSCLGDALSEVGRTDRLGRSYWLAAATQLAGALPLLATYGAYGAVLLVIIGEIALTLCLAGALAREGFALHWRQLLVRPLAIAAIAAGSAVWLGPWSFVVACTVAAASIWWRPSAEELALQPWRSQPAA